MILPGNLTNTLPKVIYEEFEGTLSISGRSTSPEVEEYFEEFIPYLKDNLIKDPIDIVASFDFDFFNTKTSRIIMKILYILKKHVYDAGKNLKISWAYEEGDEDLFEAGKDYEDIIKIPFEFIEKPMPE
jgi:hypothetical protein